jgi:sialate O-acetylesterase
VGQCRADEIREEFVLKSGFMAAAAFAALALPVHADSLLNPVFQDHAVLQRDMPIRVWGTAAPGAAIAAVIGNASADAQADASGRWSAELPAMTAGGPYTLTVRTPAGASQTLSDILIGDVYLCSGQSNMAMGVMGAVDAGPDIQVSTNDSIRLMTVANVTKPAPQSALPIPVQWTAAAPKSVVSFSATCYFFGRDLQKSVHVPLGLIQSAWPGANITAFMSAEALHKTGGNDARLDALKLYANDPATGMKRWGEVIEAWWHGKLGTVPWTDPSVSANWPLAPRDLGVWTEWKLPEFGHLIGHVWFRTSVTLTASQAEQAEKLSLGTLTEEDQTWINGRFLASTFGYGEERTYALPTGMLHEGVNDVLVNVYCSWRGCGMFGPVDTRAIRLRDGSSVPLSTSWRYQVVPASVGTSPRIPWGATAGITMAYNAMIAPLGPYGLKGVLWYQGESNTSTAETYRGLMKEWMADWRGLFRESKLPFLIVQLPDYGLPPFTPEESDWARLREAQRLAVADDPDTALAVTIDIGDHMGLHPANKQEVGRRLSLAARRLIYGDTAVKPGPMPAGAKRKGATVIVDFTGANGKLAAASAAQPIGFELCGLKTCRFASATIRGNAVAVAVPRGLNPTRVRYCWGDGPVCTLYDSTRIPAAPFELSLTGPSIRQWGHNRN